MTQEDINKLIFERIKELEYQLDSLKYDGDRYTTPVPCENWKCHYGRSWTTLANGTIDYEVCPICGGSGKFARIEQGKHT